MKLCDKPPDVYQKNVNPANFHAENSVLIIYILVVKSWKNHPMYAMAAKEYIHASRNTTLTYLKLRKMNTAPCLSKGVTALT